MGILRLSKIMDTRKLTGKLSAIAISILLASCGGGSYYDGNNSGTNNGGGTTISAVNITNITLRTHK